MEIGPDTKVTLNFAVKLMGGEIVDSNFDREPVSFKMGDGNLLPGFERALCGLQAGQRAELPLSAEQAFGQYREDNVQTFNVDQFAEDLQVGLVMTFSDAARGEVPGVIKEIRDDKVLVDFNHPLAGRDLIFEVLIHQVEVGHSH